MIVLRMWFINYCLLQSKKKYFTTYQTSTKCKTSISILNGHFSILYESSTNYLFIPHPSHCPFFCVFSTLSKDNCL